MSFETADACSARDNMGQGPWVGSRGYVSRVDRCNPEEVELCQTPTGPAGCAALRRGAGEACDVGGGPMPGLTIAAHQH